MTSSIRLGRIAGIDVGLNWSWLVVFALVVWMLGVHVFPREVAGLEQGTYFAMAVVAAVLFFASVLAHELGHAIQARREGMEIDGITLWLFGGVAKFKGMFPSAGAEFRIAIAGPLVSLAIGVAFLGLAALVELPRAVLGVVAWLGAINLILLVFNMLPALPLDGGRVLRSALWGARGDFGWATQLAANIGRGFGFVFIALGLLLFFQGAGIGGIWLAFIGWFLLGAASGEARYLAVREALGGLRVRDLMVRDPATVPPTLTLGQFMDDVVWNRRYTTYPVVEGERPLGLLPFRKVAEVPRAEWDGRPVRDCMIGRDDVLLLSQDDEVVDVLPELGEGVGRALVLEGDRLIGFLSVTDVARALEINRRRGRRSSPQEWGSVRS
ncbi:MAG TPA: site-2 protease family protein [Gaiellaceae bacterium]|nr:site-2 protease family protein [Gaiellaceae bacterium]